MKYQEGDRVMIVGWDRSLNICWDGPAIVMDHDIYTDNVLVLSINGEMSSGLQGAFNSRYIEKMEKDLDGV